MKKGRILALVLTILAVICGGYGLHQYLQEERAGETYESIREKVVSTPKPKKKEKKAASNKSLVEIPIDFVALQAINPDVYAWIQIPGTAVDYPILQREGDRAYYLTHTIEGRESPEGAIYTEDYNEKDFEDPNTLIYGHDMKNGSMFQSIHNYMDRAFFDANRAVTIYLPEKILHYEIFAAYLYDSRHLMLSFDYEDKTVYEQYLREIFAMREMNAFVDTAMEVTSDDKIITLSTCYAGNPEVRYLVQAVLVSIEE